MTVQQSRSQDFAKGGLFFKLETIVNDLDSNYHQSEIKLRRFSAPNQVISKKKRSSTKFRAFFCPNSSDLRKKQKVIMCTEAHFHLSTSSQDLLHSHPNFVWGKLFSFLGQKSALKLQKTCYFAYFSGQWEGL